MSGLHDTIEELVGNPTFGAATNIRERCATFAELALQMLARWHRGAFELLQALNAMDPPARVPVMLDGVVRDAISRATEKHDVGDVFQAAARVLAETSTLLDYQDGIAAGKSWASIWDDRDGEFHGHFKAMFDRQVAHTLTPGEVTLRNATSAELTRLRDAAALLDAHTPSLFESALAHAPVIAIVDAAAEAPLLVESFSWLRFPSTIFLSPRAFSSTELTAELLLHEATHHKHYDLRRSRSIIAERYDTQRAHRFVAAWNPTLHPDDAPIVDDDNRWPTARAISAGHVYVVLALWSASRDARGELAQTHARRARCLMDHLAGEASRDLGLDGVALVAWLSERLEAAERMS